MKEQFLYQLLSLVCGLFALGWLIIFFYIAPHLLLHLTYDVPLFLARWSDYLQLHQDLDGYLLTATILLPLLVLSGVFAYMARAFANVSEDQARGDSTAQSALACRLLNKPEKTTEALDSEDRATGKPRRTLWGELRPMVVLGALMVLVLAAIFIFEFYINIDTAHLRP